MMTTSATWSKVATECCICGLTLTDATSIDRGIGPICRKKYRYEDAFPLTEDIKVAAASYVSTRPETFSPEFIEKLGPAMAQPLSRKAANLTVYYASAEQGETAVHCAALLRIFGYNDLADRIEDRLVAVSIKRVGGEILVRCPYSPAFVDAMHHTDGAYFSRKLDKAWVLPDVPENATKLHAALKANYPGVFCVGPKGFFTL